MQHAKEVLKRNLTNMPGWRSKRKIVVFESDDWGGQRMPSRKAFEGLLKAGIPVDKSKYNTFDSLEKRADLEALFSVLRSAAKPGRSTPKFTFNTVMGNPDFEAIAANGFEEFVHQPFFTSYRYYYGQDLQDQWRMGMEEGLMTPQFHAREHVNQILWMRDLKRGQKDTRAAFDHHFFGFNTVTSSPIQKDYLAAYHAENEEELAKVIQITRDGLRQFESVFQMPSASFIGCQYVWSHELEDALQDNGVRFLQGQRGHLVPQLNEPKRSVEYHYTGQKNKNGQIYMVRNVMFEPYLNQDADWVNMALSQIRNAFFWGKPAIVLTHRINYVSNLSEKHRDSSLQKLSELLQAIQAKWPNVEFMSSDELGRCIANDK